MINEIENDLRGIISPKHLLGSWELTVSENLIQIGHVRIISDDLSRFLGTSRQVVILASTLGISVDVYLQKLMHTDMAKAVLADNLASKLIEEYVNETQTKLGIEGKRYSPGYGDFNIKHQKDLLKILNCEKIGLYMTDSYMLTPSKSITAILKTEAIT